MEINLIDLNKEEISKPILYKVKNEIWKVKINNQAILKLLKYENALRRQVCANTKTRAQVQGGGKKPWKQKGTGRARQGSIRSPQWKGGGVVFGPNLNRNYTFKINKKVKKLAIKSALSAKVENSIIVLKPILEKPSSKKFQSFLTKLKVVPNKRVLFIDFNFDYNFFKSLANFPKVKYITYRILNCYDLINADYIIFEKQAIIKINEVY